jgi:hypothetical protein
VIICGALTCVGHQLSAKWNKLAKEKKPTGCGLQAERTSQVQALQREIEEDIHSLEAAPSGADGLPSLPVGQGEDATGAAISLEAAPVNPISPTASGEMGSDEVDEESPAGHLREASSSSRAQDRMNCMHAAASVEVKKKTTKQAEIRWSANPATWTLFFECVRAVKPALLCVATS